MVSIFLPSDAKKLCSGSTVQDVLQRNAFQGTPESLVQVHYQPESVWGYIEVWFSMVVTINSQFLYDAYFSMTEFCIFI